MAENSTDALFLQVDASVELLRRHMAEGEVPLDKFAAAAETMAKSVDASIATMGAKFGPFAKLAEDAAARAQRAFEDGFSSIEKMAAKAITTPRFKDGTVTVGAADARAAAEEAQRYAGAVRLVEQAARQAAAGEGVLTAEMQAYLNGARAATIEAERHAADLMREAGAIEQVEIELNKLGVAQNQSAIAGNAVTKVSGQARAGMQQLGFQLNDVATQFSSGTPPLQIFAQQSGQVVQALGLMAEGGKGVLGFLAGPWGMALTAAVIVLAPFVAKLFEGNAELDKAVKKLKDDAHQADVSRQAHDMFNKTLEGEIALQRDLTKAIEDRLRTERQSDQLALLRAQNNLANQRKSRAALVKSIADEQATLKALLAAPPDTRNVSAGVAYAQKVAEAQQKIAGMKAQLAQADASIADQERTVNMSQAPLVQGDVAASLDKRTAATLRYTEALGLLNARLAVGAGKTGKVAVMQADGSFKPQSVTGISVEQYRTELRRIEKERDDAIKAAEEEKKKPAQTYSSTGVSLKALHDAVLGQESGGNAKAVSSAGARGLMQTMPGTLRDPGYGVTPARNNSSAEMKRVGDDYLDALLKKYDGNVTLALMAYNWGPGKVDNLLKIAGDPRSGKISEKAFLAKAPKETQDYVPAVLKRASIGKADDSLVNQIDKERAAAAKKLLDDQVAYSEDERAARHRLLDAMGKGADSEEKRVQLAQDDVDAEAAAYKVKVDGLLTEGKINQAQHDHLLELNESTRLQKRQNITNDAIAKSLDQNLEISRRELDGKASILQLQLDQATTLKKRREIAQQLLDIELQERREAAQRLLKSNDPNDRARGQADLDQVNREEPFLREQNKQKYAGPMDQYRKQLHDAAGDMDTALQNVQVHGLQTLEEGLLGVVNGTETVAGAFKKMAMSIIADLARIAIEKAIMSALGGGFAGGHVGGGSPSAFTQSFATGRIPGFASGVIRGPGNGTSDSILALMQGVGLIRVSNGESIVTAEATRRFGPLLDAMNRGKLPKFASGSMPRLSYPSVPAAGWGASRPRGQDIMYVMVDKSDLFDVHVQRASAPQARAAMMGAVQVARQDQFDMRSQAIPV